MNHIHSFLVTVVVLMLTVGTPLAQPDQGAASLFIRIDTLVQKYVEFVQLRRILRGCVV
jgi:hypothetical protein